VREEGGMVEVKELSRGGVEDRRLLFWNIEGLGRQDLEFWRYISKWDFISLCETWVEEKGWDRIRNQLPSSHSWSCSFAYRDRKRGRAKGGFIFGIKRNWLKEEEVRKQELNKEVVIHKMDRKGKGKNIVIASVYGTEKWENLEEVINRIMESYREEYIIIGGDFNARIGEGGRRGGRRRGSSEEVKIDI